MVFVCTLWCASSCQAEQHGHHRHHHATGAATASPAAAGAAATHTATAHAASHVVGVAHTARPCLSICARHLHVHLSSQPNPFLCKEKASPSTSPAQMGRNVPTPLPSSRKPHMPKKEALFHTSRSRPLWGHGESGALRHQKAGDEAVFGHLRCFCRPCARLGCRTHDS